MPLLTFDSPVARVSGRLGTAPNTYTFNNGAPVLRAQVGPTNPDSTDQQAIRAIFSAVTKEWKLLTQAQRTNWTAFAQANNVTNRLGRSVGRNGMSAFVELNTGWYIQSGAILDPAPTLPRPSAASSITINGTQAGGTNLSFKIEHAYSVLTGLYLVVRATPETTYQSQTPKPSDYRLIQGVNTTSIVPLVAVGTAYTFTGTRYAYSEDNGFVGVEVSIMNSEGWQSVSTRQVLQISL